MKNAKIARMFISAQNDSSVVIDFPDGSSMEVTLTGDTMQGLSIDDRYMKLRERANRHIESAMSEAQFVSVPYRGRDYLCRKVWWREQQTPETPFELTLITTAHLSRILLHDTNCEVQEIVDEANAVDARCAFSLEDISGSDEQFIKHLYEKYSDMEFKLQV